MSLIPRHLICGRCDGVLPPHGRTEAQRCTCPENQPEAMVDPGVEIADKILNDLEELVMQPKDVARGARRLRAHIRELRRQVYG